MRAKTTILLLLAICLTGCVERVESKGGYTPVTSTTEYLRVATWNVRNFFDTTCDTRHCEEGDYEPMLSEEEYQLKLSNVAEGIRRTNADIIMLQEIEKEECIKDIQAALPEYRYYIFGETNKAASVDVGILSKYEITKSEKYRESHPFTIDETEYYIARELLHATIVTEKQTQLEVITAHFISHVSDDPGVRRREEVRITSEILAEINANNKNSLVIFGGDLNDAPGTETLNTLDEKSSLKNGRQGTAKENDITCQAKYNLDHLYNNEKALNALIDTEIVCNSGNWGYSSSDHCAVIGVYGIVHNEEKK